MSESRTKLEKFMLRACDLGKQAEAISGDNPYVGCVITKGWKIVGEGHTGAPGSPHAEVSAIEDVRSQGIDLKNSVLFSTVEPCSFDGRTPSCARTISKCGFRKVVIGIRDPHPKVNGSGVLILKEAGLNVLEGVCERQVREYLSKWLRQYESE